MKIAFWSNGDYSSGVTSNLACISVASTFEYAHKAILIESHQQKNKLENMLRYNINYRLKEVQNQLRQLGMGHILNYYLMNLDKAESLSSTNQSYQSISSDIEESFEHEPIDKKSMDNDSIYRSKSNIVSQSNMKPSNNLIKDSSLEILYDKLYYLPTDYVSNHHMYEYKLYQIIKELLSELDDFADITYIDTSGHKLSSKIIIDEADVIVVNLIQNEHMIRDFFSNYSSILHKCVFLVSNYHNHSNINLNYISKNYLIPRSLIVAIPYNEDYQLALTQGTVVEFLARNYKCNRNNPNYPFAKQIKLAVRMIHQCMNKTDKQYLTIIS